MRASAQTRTPNAMPPEHLCRHNCEINLSWGSATSMPSERPDIPAKAKIRIPSRTWIPGSAEMTKSCPPELEEISGNAYTNWTRER